ncbi:MAG: hypothetical protein ACP5OG_01700 [Candidatus Nanoarchaeia archaeon]
MKIDPHKNKERFLNWKDKNKSGIKGISKTDSKLVLDYLSDMEIGQNIGIGSKKGGRSYIRLNSSKDKLMFIIRNFEENFNLNNIISIKEKDLHSFFSDMREGKIKKSNGEIYKSVGDYVKTFKAFWHWYQKVNRKRGVSIEDITIDLDSKTEKPKWVYLTDEQIKNLVNVAQFNYKVLIWFLIDSGIRSPTELMNIRISDFSNNYKELNIKDEISKTFGRKIKLMICSDLVKSYVIALNLKQDDKFWTNCPGATNRYLKKLAKRVLGEDFSPAGQKYSEISLYDFRHNSACYWLPRYPKQQDMMYRFGWKEANKIFYYTEFLGMRDNISQESMLTEPEKGEIKQKQDDLERENAFLNEKIASMELQMKKILEWTELVQNKLNQVKQRR